MAVVLGMISRSEVKTIKYTSDLIISEDRPGIFTLRNRYPRERFGGFILPSCISITFFIASGIYFEILLLMAIISLIYIMMASMWIFHEPGNSVLEASENIITIDGVKHLGIVSFWEFIIFNPAKEEYLAVYGVHLVSCEKVCAFQTDARQLFGEFRLWKNLAEKINTSYIPIFHDPRLKD